MNINKVFVTGSEGFVGKHLCRHLSGNRVSIVSGDKNEDNKFNVTNIEQLQSVEDAEAIIHRAAKVGVLYSYDNSLSIITSLLGTFMLIFQFS